MAGSCWFLISDSGTVNKPDPVKTLKKIGKIIIANSYIEFSISSSIEYVIQLGNIFGKKRSRTESS